MKNVFYALLWRGEDGTGPTSWWNTTGSLGSVDKALILTPEDAFRFYAASSVTTKKCIQLVRIELVYDHAGFDLGCMISQVSVEKLTDDSVRCSV